MNEQQAAIAALRAEFERWDALLAGLSEAQITDPQLPEGWSIKDVVAHLHAWQQRSIARMQAALHGGEPAYPPWPAELDPEMEDQPHDLNAWLYAQTRDLPWPDIFHNWRDGFLRFLELSESLPEADLLDTKKYEWLEGYAMIDVLEGSCEHHREHAEYLEPVLARMI
jgi:hypothetical protein